MRSIPVHAILLLGLLLPVTARGELLEPEWSDLKKRWKSCGYMTQMVVSAPQVNLEEIYNELRQRMIDQAAASAVPSEQVAALADEFDAGRVDARGDGWVGERYNLEASEEELNDAIAGAKGNFEICNNFKY